MSESPVKPGVFQSLNAWLAHSHPKCWGRYWGARLMATTYYSKQLNAQCPEISGWMSVKRHGLGLLIFALPIRLPVRPEFHPDAANTNQRPAS